MWLVVSCSLICHPDQDLGHLRLVNCAAPERKLEEIFPSHVSTSSCGTSRAVLLVKATFGHASVLGTQLIILRPELYSRANYVPGIVDHFFPDERNARAADPEKWNCRLLI